MQYSSIGSSSGRCVHACACASARQRLMMAIFLYCCSSYIVFGDVVFYWGWSLPFGLGELSRKPVGSVSVPHSADITDVWCCPQLLHDAGVWIQVFMHVQHSLPTDLSLQPYLLKEEISRPCYQAWIVAFLVDTLPQASWTRRNWASEQGGMITSPKSLKQGGSGRNHLVWFY